MLHQENPNSQDDSTIVDADTDIQDATWADIMPTTDDGSIDYSAFSPN